MLRLVRENGVTADDVAEIDIMTHQRRLRHTDTPFPTSALQAKFSVQYAVVRALLSGTVGLAALENDAFLEADVERLLDITTARPFADDGPESGGPWDAEVSVQLKTGRRLSKRLVDLVGRSGDNAMSDR